jgi:NAD(P) transhydrogenase subunit beta
MTDTVLHAIVHLAYLAAAVLFILSLHWMNAPKDARRGVLAGVAAMTLAIAATWMQPGITHHWWIIGAIVAGFAVGVPLSRVSLTAVPQRTALSHAFGGLAAGLVGTAKYYSMEADQLTWFRMLAIVAEVLLGFLTLTGSLMAAGKLQGVSWIPQRPVVYPRQNVVNLGLLGLAAVLGLYVIFNPS